jgi:hypothetical protein
VWQVLTIFNCRDIHQDNGELIDIVHGIHGDKPDNCAELENLAAANGPATDKGSDVPDPDAPNPEVTDPNSQSSMTGSSDPPMSVEAGETSHVPKATKNEDAIPKPADTSVKCKAFEVKCMSGEGSPEYHECVYNRFMVRPCAAGTVCRTDNGIASCGAPIGDSERAKDLPNSTNEENDLTDGFPISVSAKDVKDKTTEPSLPSSDAFPAPVLVKETEGMESINDLVEENDEMDNPSFDIPEEFVGDYFGDIGAETTAWPLSPTPTPKA